MFRIVTLSFFIASLFATLTSMRRPTSIISDAGFPENPTTIIKGKGGIVVKAFDISSKISTFSRGLEITSDKDGAINFKFELVYESDNVNENIYEVLKNTPQLFSGRFLVKARGQEIYSLRIEKGVAQKGVRKMFKTMIPPVYDPTLVCGVGTVHDCVAYEIEDMNWIEYALCMASSPGCYASLWASCTWEVCHNKMRYTDPNGTSVE